MGLSVSAVSTSHLHIKAMQIIKIIAIATIVATSAFTMEMEFNELVPEGELATSPLEDTVFVAEVDAVVGDELLQIQAKCSGAKSYHKKAVQEVKQSIKMVKYAIAHRKRTCDAQAKASEKKKKDAKKLQISGPTFKFNNDKCKGGKGTFKKAMKKGGRATVGVIPAHQNNVKVYLNSVEDVDLEVWGPLGKIALVAFSCKGMNMNHKTPTACLDAGDKATIKYAGATITYSGWNGQMGKHGYHETGNEYIKISGKSAVALTIKTFGYVAGVSNIKYSWGVDKDQCAKQKAAQKAKFDAMALAKKSLKEKDFKKASKLVQATTKSCTGAKGGVKSAQAALAKAHKSTKTWEAKIRTCVEKATKEKSHKKEKGRKNELAAKAAKEKKQKAQEKARKKHESKKREQAEKEKLQKAAEKRDKKEKAAKEKAKKKERAAKKKEVAAKKEQKIKAEKKAKKAKEAKKKAEVRAKVTERTAKAAEKAQKKKEKNKKQREQSKKAELSKKAKEKHHKAEKALKHKREKEAKKQEKNTKEATSKERSSKERNSREWKKPERNMKARRESKQRRKNCR